MYPCVVCKGRRCKEYFGVEFCPLKAKIRLKSRVAPKGSFVEPIRVPLVGRRGYPAVRSGIVTGSDEHDERFDAEVERRMGTLSIQKDSNVKRPEPLFQAVVLADRAYDMDVSIDRPRIDPTFEPGTPPSGGSARLRSLREAEHMREDRFAGTIASDRDLKASDAMVELSERFGEERISQILSTGAIGTRERRKQVPTRWSITAADSALSDADRTELLRETITEPELRIGSHFGNVFYLLLMPGPFAYELIELHVSSGSSMSDFETPRGRSSYADETAGGYYAVRRAALEHLRAREREAQVLALRLITDDYSVPLGVWVVREAARKALAADPITFDSEARLFAFVTEHAKRRYSAHVLPLLSGSALRSYRASQRTLDGFVTR
jgi:DNA repair protein NreA